MVIRRCAAYQPTLRLKQPVTLKKKFSTKTLERFFCLSSVPPHTIIILAGDFNARIGRDSHLTNSKTVGNSCFHDLTNDNGQRLIELCESTEIRPIQTHFDNRRSRLSTYRDPNGKYYQLDHIMISSKWWKSIKSCRSFNSVDIMSDHKMVSAYFRLSLRKTKTKSNQRLSFIVEKLKDQRIRQEFD